MWPDSFTEKDAVVWLDVDGVLNCLIEPLDAVTAQAFRIEVDEIGPWPFVDQRHATRLGEWLRRHSSVQIVFSSSWRIRFVTLDG